MQDNKLGKGAVQPVMKKEISDVIQLLRDNPDFGIAFHNYFEEQRDSLLSSAWNQGSDDYDKKAVSAAMYITDEILATFNLTDLARR
jgi:hypothetical protein